MRLNQNLLKEKTEGTFLETLNIIFKVSDDEMSLEASMTVGKSFTQTMGILHGGATISLAESIAGVGSNIICANDEQCVGMQVSASHISSAQIGDIVHAKGSIIHKGRTSHIWDVEVVSEQTGKLISIIRVTNSVIKKIIYTRKI